MTNEEVAEVRKNAKKYSHIKTDYYLCHIPADPNFETAFGKGSEAYWMILTETQAGYDEANERIPYFYKEDLEIIEKGAK